MPRLSNQSLPKLRYHAGSGQHLVVLSGQSHYLGADAAEARRRYDAQVQRWLARGRKPEVRSRAAQATVAQLIDAWWAHPDAQYRKAGKPTSEIRVRRLAYTGLRRLFGDLSAADFGPEQLRELLQWWDREGLSRTSIGHCFGRVRSLWQWAAQRGLVPGESWYRLHALSRRGGGRDLGRRTDPVRPVPEAVLEATLAVLGRPWADAVQLQLLAGMRPSEVLGIRPCDLDRTGDVWVYRPSRHKTEHHGRAREIPLGPKAQAILTPLLRDGPDRSPIFPSPVRPDVPIGDLAYRRAVARACRKAGVAHWHPNQLRHNAATRIRKSFGLDAAQAALGHAKADVTQVYAELDLAKATEVARQVG